MEIKMRRYFGWFFLCLLLSSSVFATCTIEGTTTTGFGNNDGSADLGSSEVASITVNCDSEYRIGLDAGLNPSVNRRLHDSGHFIGYYLWTDTAATTEWGDNSITYPANPLTATGSNRNIRHPIFGTAMGINYAGFYNDIVHITVAYPPYGATDKLETDFILDLTMTGTCTLDSSGMTGFGTWPVGAANLTNVALGVITVNCTAGMNYRLGIDKGLTWNAGKRQMANGGNYIPYLLWTNASGTTEWGDTGLTAIESTYIETHPASAQFGIGTGNPQNFFIWGDALIQNAEIAGTYSDTVVMTVVWP
jgi:spore coat protein U-like protein